MDVELDRKVAGNWKEYLKELKRTKEMVTWIWQELITEKGKAVTKKMVALLVANCFIDVVALWFFGTLIDELSKGRFYLALRALGAFVAIISIGKYIHCKYMTLREFLFGERVYQLDKRTSEMFFGKSLGTHIDENNLLWADFRLFQRL